MEEGKEYYAKLPEGFKHLEPSLNEYLTFSKEADMQIAELNKDLAPQPRFDPPGMDKTGDRLSKQATIDRLIKEKSALYERFDTQLQKANNSVDAKKAAELQSVVQYQLESNSFTGLGKEQDKEIRGDERKLLASFEFMEHQHFQKFESHVDVNNLSQERSFEEMNERFMNMLDGPENVDYEDIGYEDVDHEPDKD